MPPTRGRAARRISSIGHETVALDRAISHAVGTTATPTLDRLLVRVSRAADRSRLWLATAATVAVLGGPAGRRAAVRAVASVGLASAVTNLVLKPASRRRRPTASGRPVASRRVPLPRSSSFPSGHAASAFAFASTMGEDVPPTWAPLHVTAALVACSRVHTGVHHTTDVVGGSLLGAMCGWAVRRLTARTAWVARTGLSPLPKGPGHVAAR